MFKLHLHHRASRIKVLDASYTISLRIYDNSGEQPLFNAPERAKKRYSGEIAK